MTFKQCQEHLRLDDFGQEESFSNVKSNFLSSSLQLVFLRLASWKRRVKQVEGALTSSDRFEAARANQFDLRWRVYPSMRISAIQQLCPWPVTSAVNLL